MINFTIGLVIGIILGCINAFLYITRVKMKDMHTYKRRLIRVNDICEDAFKHLDEELKANENNQELDNIDYNFLNGKRQAYKNIKNIISLQDE